MKSLPIPNTLWVFSPDSSRFCINNQLNKIPSNSKHWQSLLTWSVNDEMTDEEEDSGRGLLTANVPICDIWVWHTSEELWLGFETVTTSDGEDYCSTCESVYVTGMGITKFQQPPILSIYPSKRKWIGEWIQTEAEKHKMKSYHGMALANKPLLSRVFANSFLKKRSADTCVVGMRMISMFSVWFCFWI